MEMKQAAEELLKIADDLEKEAAAVTQFVCASCNHTASLETINARRIDAAQSATSDVVVSKVDVQDVVACPACGGRMAYSPTEESQRYYITADEAPKDEELGPDGKPVAPAAKTAAPIDYDSLKRYSA